MRERYRLIVLLGPSLLAAAAACAQPTGQPADLCHELLAYADSKAGGSPNVPPPSRAPPTTPRSTGAAPEPTESPHTAEPKPDGASPSGSEDPKTALPGGVTRQQLRETAARGDRQACRDVTQILRRAGADLPAELIALAAYEPDPAKRN